LPRIRGASYASLRTRDKNAQGEQPAHAPHIVYLRATRHSVDESLLAHTGPPSFSVPSISIVRTESGAARTVSINAGVIVVSGIFARLFQNVPVCPAP
jgi:hypothetical protein